jgi:hypothetical protein
MLRCADLFSATVTPNHTGAFDMANINRNELTELLEAGWTVSGYSVCLMVAGATSHHILLQNGTSLRSITVITSSGEELGRASIPLSPAPPEKKGWFG